MTPQTMERILEFCLGKIPDDDLLTLEDMLAKGVPAKDMAADAAIKRRDLLAMDCQARGYAVTRKRVLHDIVQDRAAIEALYPDMFRLGDGNRIGAVPPGKVILNRAPSRPMTKAEQAESAKMFPHMFKGD